MKRILEIFIFSLAFLSADSLDTDVNHVFQLRDLDKKPLLEFWVTKPGAAPSMPTATTAKGKGTAPATPAP